MKISNLSVIRENNGDSRVEAEVDGKKLWFSSKDIDLTDSPEAFVSCLLIPASSMNESLEIDASIDSVWLDNFSSLQNLLYEWWQLPKIELITDAFGAVQQAESYTGKVAQCFTGGVDSFYELITTKTKPDILVFIHGFDIRLKDTRRLDAFLPGFYEIADFYGCKPVVVKTNYREHFALQSINWEWSHGGALAAIGHAMNNTVGKLVVPSSYVYDDSHPWGTHWQLDPLWSSSQLTLQHADATLRRYKKIEAIADNLLVQKYLRVCWENKTAEGNCSKCEKCVRTMIALEMCGQLESSKAFDLSVTLLKRIRRLPPLYPHLVPVYEILVSKIDDPELALEVEKLLLRSPLTRKPMRERMRQWKRNLLRWIDFN